MFLYRCCATVAQGGRFRHLFLIRLSCLRAALREDVVAVRARLQANYGRQRIGLGFRALFLYVRASCVPFFATAANGGRVLTKVAIGRASIVPDHEGFFRRVRYPCEDVLRVVKDRDGVLRQALRGRYHNRDGSVQNRALTSAQFVLIVVVLVRHATSRIRASRHIASGEVRANVRDFHVTALLYGVRILANRRDFAKYVVKVRPFPSAERHAAVRGGRRPVVVNVHRGVLVGLCRLLLITARRIRLGAFGASVLRPNRFLTADSDVIRSAAQPLQDVIPVAIKVVPRVR